MSAALFAMTVCILVSSHSVRFVLAFSRNCQR